MKCDVKGCKREVVKAIKNIQINDETPELKYYCKKHLIIAEAINEALENLLENWDRIMADALFFAKEIQKAKKNE